MEQFKASILPDLNDREKRDAAARAVLDPAAYPNLFPERWSDFRRSRLTSLVIKIRTAVKAVRPDAVFSAAVVPDAQQAFDSRLQDWRGWIDQSLLDVVCPMAYTADADTFQKQIAAARAYAGSRPVWAGIGAYQMSRVANADAHRRRQPARRRGRHPLLVRRHSPPRRTAPARSASSAARPSASAPLQSKLSGVSLSGVDYLVIGVYLLAITAFGSWFARYQKTTRDYFLTDRSVPWWAICFTIVATETSTLTFIGIPAQAYTREHDVPAARGGLHHRPRAGQHPVHSRLLPRRSVHVVRVAAAPVRDARQDVVGGDLPDHPIARGRHSPVHDGPGDLDRHAGAGDLGGDRARRRDDRLHHARRRLGRDLDRRRPDVRLHCRRRCGGHRAPQPDRRRMGRSGARRDPRRDASS